MSERKTAYNLTNDKKKNLHARNIPNCTPGTFVLMSKEITPSVIKDYQYNTLRKDKRS